MGDPIVPRYCSMGLMMRVADDLAIELGEWVKASGHDQVCAALREEIVRLKAQRQVRE